jgi:hypothetical protein
MRMIVTLKSLRVIVMILTIYWKTRLLMRIHIQTQDLKQVIVVLLSMNEFMISIMALT